VLGGHHRRGEFSGLPRDGPARPQAPDRLLVGEPPRLRACWGSSPLSQPVACRGSDAAARQPRPLVAGLLSPSRGHDLRAVSREISPTWAASSKAPWLAALFMLFTFSSIGLPGSTASSASS
jgi:hypothetical protein